MPKAAPTPRNPGRLDALFRRILSNMSKPSQRKGYAEARGLILKDPEFKGLAEISTGHVP